MGFLVTTILLLCSALTMTAAQGTGVCTRADRHVTTVSYSVSSGYVMSYSCGLWDVFRCYRSRTRYHTRYRQHTIYRPAFECCYGYHDPAGGINCVEICLPSCVHGTCNHGTMNCDCLPGYTGAACQDDIQECVTNNGNCDHICTNTIGSYSCSCRNGFRATTPDASSCTDINECEGGNHGCSQICTNTPGSHNCNCRRGFQLVPGNPATQCRDVDECSVLNGFCSQLCVNTEGSYNCDCRKGYRLFGSTLCQDIDECSEMSDECNNTQPAPAKCINTDGGYDCSCAQHTGYKLSSDGTACEDVDECAEDDTICSMLCVNTPGSYNCSCPSGYELDDDGTTCTDIDECEMMTSGCQHSCTNTVGSYECSCDRGYVLSSDGLTCQGLMCDPTLDAPMNGTIDCDIQTVGGTCNFTCDKGFMPKMKSLSCLPSLMWSERPTVCDPPMCPELDPPENGFVTFPCTRKERDSCSVICAHGYRAEGPTVQICQRDTSTDTLSWSQAPVCVESDPCNPDPCENEGACTRNDEDGFQCACNGTGHGGPTCNIVIIRFAPIQPVGGEQSISIDLSSEVTVNKRIAIRINAPGVQTRKVVRLSGRNVRDTVRARVGIMTVTLPKNTDKIMYVPRERSVLVTGGSGSERPYFQQFNLPRGLIKPSCCTADEHLVLSCPGSTETVSFLSPCEWSTNKAEITRTLGSVFAQTSSMLTLPVSISGLRYRDVPRGGYVNNFRNTGEMCSSCDRCIGGNDNQCYCYNHAPQHTLEFLQSRALGYTYISEIQKLLPSWLEMEVDLDTIKESSPFTMFDYFAPVTKPSQEVSSVEGCEKLTDLMNGLFSVLRYDKALSATINGVQYTYSETSAGGGSENTMCFAIDMCQGLSSPVHMQISAPINKIITSQLLHMFTNRGWNILFNTISVFKKPVPTYTITRFWNGDKFIETPEVLVDVSLNKNATVIFEDDSLSMDFVFGGKAKLSYEEKAGYLDGSVDLEVKTTILDAQQSFKLTSDETEFYCHIGGNPCQSVDDDLYGISFQASYEPQPGELFFSRLFRFTETTQSCTFHAFIPINSDYRALGLSLYTECPLLAVDELIFPEMTHKITFSGSRNPNCLTSMTTGKALLIESELINDRLPLGSLLELKRNSTGPDITTMFSKSGAGPVSVLHTVGVTLFGEMFTTQAIIEDNLLKISASRPIFGYPAEYTIRAPSNETDWKDLMYRLQGSLRIGSNGFIDRLSSIVGSKLQALGESGSSRQQVAQMSLDQARERYDKIQARYLEAEENVTQAEGERDAAYSAIQSAQDIVTELEMQFNSGEDELSDLRDMLDALCQEQTCEDICMPGRTCKECTRPIFIQRTGMCPVIKMETVTVRVPPEYIFRRQWRWVTRCGRKVSGLCLFGGCLFSWSSRKCRGVCALVPVRVPHTQYKMITRQTIVYEQCTMRNVFDGFVPYTCCEMVNCAALVPDSSCITSNAQCRSLREEKVTEIADLGEANRELFQGVTNARKTLSLAKTAARMADIKYEKYTQRRNQTQASRDRLSSARDTARKIYDDTLGEIGPLLRINRGGSDNGFKNIFRINSVSFNTKTATSPSSLGLTINFENLLENDNMRYEETYGYVSQLKEANLERIANSIIDQAFLGSSKRSATMLHARARRQTEEEETEEEQSQRRVFETRCAQSINTRLFFIEIQTKLEEVIENITSLRGDTNPLSQNLTMSQTDEEVQAYLELIRSYEELSMDAIASLESTIFADWQASMESLYNQSSSVGEVSCGGFADCIQTAIDELRSLVTLTPETDLSQEFVTLFSNIDSAQEMVLDLALLSNITVEEGLVRIAPIVNITSAYVNNNFWCNDPPVIVTQLPPQVNVSLGGTLQLLCEARSNLSLTYEWKKEGNVLPQFTTNVLTISSIQRLDSANYTCSATNPVGTVDTIPSGVTVYELPQFYLEPESLVTYLGDDDGALFTCNASAWPYPGWRWYHRNSTDSKWTQIEGEDTNELLILDPQEKDRGQYVCVVFNFFGHLRSKPVSLTLLPMSVSQYLTPLEFSVSIGDNYSCHDVLYDSIHSLLLETITGETATIEDFNITQADTESYDISLSLVSRNITTPYTHLLAYEEIANLALPHIQSLSKSVQVIQDVLSGDISDHIPFGSRDFHDCSSSGSGDNNPPAGGDNNSPTSGDNNDSVLVQEGSVVVGKRTYVCPPGQQLRSDYLLCMSCERGMFSSQQELSRIVNGNGFSEVVPVCQACPLDTFANQIGSHTCSSCPKYHTTITTGSDSIQDCLPQPLVLECQTNTTRGHVSIDCKTNRPIQKTLCTFNDGLEHPCTYPVDINRDVSPLGNHSLIISVEDDENFEAKTTVDYFLEEDIKPIAEPSVPPLVVLFTNDSPRVVNDSVEANISLSRPVKSLMCRLRGRHLDTIEKDCSSGFVRFDSLNDSFYFLRVVATNRHPDKVFIKTSFEITSDPTRCTLHLINGGVTISGNDVTVEFTGRGPALGYRCHLDKLKSFECSSPVVFSDLAPGEHSLKIRQTGCGANRMNIRTKIRIT